MDRIDMQMDVRDMSFFPDDSFDGVIDKGMNLFLCVLILEIYNVVY